MEQTENKQINVKDYTQTTSVKIIAAFKVLKAVIIAAFVVCLVVFAATFNSLVKLIAVNFVNSVQSTVTVGSVVELPFRLFNVMANTPLIPSSILCIIAVVEAVGYVNLVNSDHGEKPIRVICCLRMLWWMLNILWVIFICVTTVIHLHDKSAAVSIWMVLLGISSVVTTYFFGYRYNHDIADIMRSVAEERKTGTPKYFGGKGLLWKATTYLIGAIVLLIFPIMAMLCGGVDAITNMFAEIFSGENALQSIASAGTTTLIIALSLIIPAAILVRFIAVTKAAKKFNSLH